MTTGGSGDAPIWSLPEQYLKTLAEHGSVKAYPKNAVIVNEGDQSDSLYVIVSGKVKIYLADEEGKEVLLNTQGPGEYFGEIILDEGPRSASVMTLEPSKFSIVSKTQFQQFLATHPEAALELIRSLIQKVRSLTKSVGNLALLDVYGRVARSLLDMAEMDGETKTIRNKVSRQDLAKVVGASREMVSRVMKDLEERGMIQTQENGSVIIKEQLTQ